MTSKLLLIAGSQVLEILLKERMLLDIIRLDQEPLDDTIWVNGERVKLDPDVPIDFTALEERVIRSMGGDDVLRVEDFSPTHRLTGDEFKLATAKEEKPAAPDHRPRNPHPRSPRKGKHNRR